MKEILMEDETKNTKIKTLSKQIRHNNHTCSQHHENANGDIVFYCKHRRNKRNNCTAKVKKTAKGEIVVSDEHGLL